MSQFLSSNLGLTTIAIVSGVVLLILYINMANYSVGMFYNRKLKRQGRVIFWTDALRRTQSGEGVFVIYIGRLWWIEGKFSDDHGEIYTATEEKGLLVQSHPKTKLVPLLSKEAPGQFKTIDSIPFVDYELK